MVFFVSLTLPVPIPDEQRKLTQLFVFTLPFGASKDFKGLPKT